MSATAPAKASRGRSRGFNSSPCRLDLVVITCVSVFCVFLIPALLLLLPFLSPHYSSYDYGSKGVPEDPDGRRAVGAEASGVGKMSSDKSETVEVMETLLPGAAAMKGDCDPCRFSL